LRSRLAQESAGSYVHQEYGRPDLTETLAKDDAMKVRLVLAFVLLIILALFLPGVARAQTLAESVNARSH